ncbi:MAG TPA: ImmA/IrrE family metallo-endopeptidase [Myxococcus sp.]|nr:ImmA/IrrE family metallo-endopeptidase [Myxococcus sp.]
METWKDLGARLAEARRAAGLSQAELATELRLDRTAITRIEAGERRLDALELTRVAELLKRPVDWFLIPSPLAVVSRRQSRDVADDSQADWLLESLARDVSLLVEVKALSVPESFRPKTIESVASAETAARDVRKSLGLPAGPVWNLQAIAERAGLFVFSLNLEKEMLDGSYLRLERGGVALVNGRAQTGRRRFTSVHELGHHVFADAFSAEWIVGTDADDRERLINAFAIHFLMPRESVLPRWQELDGSKEPRHAAIVLGAEYGVSWTAVLGHLCNLKLIDDGTRDRLEADRPRRADYFEGEIPLKEELAPPSIPPRYAQAVVRAFKGYKVSAERALELLRGTLDADELPPRDAVPLDSMRSQLDLD